MNAANSGTAVPSHEAGEDKLLGIVFLLLRPVEVGTSPAVSCRDCGEGRL